MGCAAAGVAAAMNLKLERMARSDCCCGSQHGMYSQTVPKRQVIIITILSISRESVSLL